MTNPLFLLAPASQLCRWNVKSVELGCLADTIEIAPGVVSIDMDQMEGNLARHFTAMHRLREELGLSEETCEEIAEGVISLIRNASVERIEGDEYQ